MDKLRVFATMERLFTHLAAASIQGNPALYGVSVDDQVYFVGSYVHREDHEHVVLHEAFPGRGSWREGRIDAFRANGRIVYDPH